jgi:hypothetical protein
MSKISYHRWEVVGNTVRAYGGKVKEYRHNIPFQDFLEIIKKIQDIYSKEGIVSKLDILNIMHNTTLSGGRIFNKKSHEYKVKMSFDILLMEGIIRRKGIKSYPEKKGRPFYGYVTVKTKNDIATWLNNLKIR